MPLRSVVGSVRIIALAIVLSATTALAFNRGCQLGIEVGTVDNPVVEDLAPVQPKGSSRAAVGGREKAA